MIEDASGERLAGSCLCGAVRYPRASWSDCTEDLPRFDEYTGDWRSEAARPR